jgi:hypothetical protein
MKKHHQKATVWVQIGVDRYGVPSYAEPIQIMCRWEDRETVYIGVDGRERRGQSIIYTPSKAASVGDFIAQGHHTEASPVNGSFEVRSIRAIPNLSATAVEHRIVL